MGTKDLTHDAIARALTNGDLLTHEQRSALLGLVADDAVWQRKHDEMAEQLACVRQALPEEWRDSVPSVAVATLTAELERLNLWADGMTDAMLKERAAADATIKALRETVGSIAMRMAKDATYRHRAAEELLALALGPNVAIERGR